MVKGPAAMHPGGTRGKPLIDSGLSEAYLSSKAVYQGTGLQRFISTSRARRQLWQTQELRV